jgi:hypothetical protein
MWVIQHEALLQVPDDVPVPPESVVTELPEDFFADPSAYTVTDEGVRKRPAKELKKLRDRQQAGWLSRSEIAAIKAAIKAKRL